MGFAVTTVMVGVYRRNRSSVPGVTLGPGVINVSSERNCG